MKYDLNSVIFYDEEVPNKNRKFGSLRSYFPAILKYPDGKEVPMLFTKHDLEQAMERASKNTEDLPIKDTPSFLSWLFD